MLSAEIIAIGPELLARIATGHQQSLGLTEQLNRRGSM